MENNNRIKAVYFNEKQQLFHYGDPCQPHRSRRAGWKLLGLNVDQDLAASFSKDLYDGKFGDRISFSECLSLFDEIVTPLSIRVIIRGRTHFFRLIDAFNLIVSFGVCSYSKAITYKWRLIRNVIFRRYYEAMKKDEMWCPGDVTDFIQFDWMDLFIPNVSQHYIGSLMSKNESIKWGDSGLWRLLDELDLYHAGTDMSMFDEIEIPGTVLKKHQGRIIKVKYIKIYDY